MPALRKSRLRGLKRLWHRARGTRTFAQHGIRLSTDPALVPKTVRYGIFAGVYEGAEAELVTAHLRPGDRVLEIGAGTGFVSLLAARICGAENVHSFEANPAMREVIEGNYALNGLAPTLHMQAVTTDGAPVTFHFADNVVSSSLYDRQLEGRALTVESRALPDLLRELAPSVIVMDVEGAEIDLLAKGDLAGVDRLIIELHPHIVGADRIDALLASLAARGFREAARVDKNVLLRRDAA